MSQAESALRINIEDIVRGSFGLLGDWLTSRKMVVCKNADLSLGHYSPAGCAISKFGCTRLSFQKGPKSLTFNTLFTDRLLKSRKAP